MSFISRKYNQFTYFNLQLGRPVWGGKKVLDFGGNVGNILKDPDSTIDQHLYWCLDVSRDAIEMGERAFPEAHWSFYNRYNFAFNPTGIEGLPIPETGQKFDFILSYSVFTHTGETEMIELVEHLRGMLERGGLLAFTFIDPHYETWPGRYDGNNLKWRLDRSKEEYPGLDVESLLERARGASFCSLVNHRDLYLEGEEIRHYQPRDQYYLDVFYTADHIKSLFPEARILPPINGEMQHCCLFESLIKGKWQ